MLRKSESELDKEGIKAAISGLTVWKRGGQRAPHKPLLVLYALGRCLKNCDRFVPFKVVNDDLKRLLMDFGPYRKSHHPEYPFWRLRNDGVWELKNADNLVNRRGNTDAKKSELLRARVSGGFTNELYESFRENQPFIFEVAQMILNENFPESIHEDILLAVGIEPGVISGGAPARDPRFREKILRAYEYRCSVCGFDVRVGALPVALEAAHIKWHQAGGPSEEPNGVALCSLHHKLFDRGAFGIDKAMRVLVSENANGQTGFNEWLMDFHGKSLRKPIRETYKPKTSFTEWHMCEVFHGPSRV